jgi:hypothetical protein
MAGVPAVMMGEVVLIHRLPAGALCLPHDDKK